MTSTLPTCLIDECDGKPHAHGLCLRCYQRDRQANAAPCIVDGCTKPRRNVAGHCEMHYARLRRVGSLNVPRPIGLPIAERWARYAGQAGPDECWEWTGTRNNHGYGRLDIDDRPGYAHRISYELHHAPIPEGLVVMHSCDNPPCVNPAHLSVGTQADNMRDAATKGRLVPGGRR